MNLTKQWLKILRTSVYVLVLFTGLFLLSACSKDAKPVDTFNSYKKSWEKQDFKAMYSLLSIEAKGKITEADFIKRYQNIYTGIEAANVNIKSENVENIKPDKSGNTVIPFSVAMDTLAGKTEIQGYKMTLVKEKADKKNTWTVLWDEKLIFTDLEASDKVKATIFYPLRGEISDRNGKGLAVNGTINTIGIVPSKFNAVKDTAIPEMAQILDISQDKIAGLLKASTNPDWFVPIVNLSSDDKDKSSKLTAIPGVQYQKKTGRVYPAGEASALLVGYMGAITEEELKNHKNEGYSAQDKIGKMGLEQVYDKRLKGEKGGEIYIVKDGDDTSKNVIAKKEAKDGENIKLSIDFDTQKKIYDEMKNDAGACAAINPKSGEILALVSSPSFDPNLYSTYVPDSTRKAWDSAVKSPFTNRFKAVYAPGSTFKLVTGAIGLKAGIIKPDEALNITGTEWQPDKSWGSNTVTRVHDPGKPINLLDAYVYSDNIYFAMEALKIGKDTLTNEAKNFGIGEILPIDYPVAKSQLSNNGLSSNQLIADTGFGQGEVQLSPLNLALIYSALANNGDIMTPVLELKDGFTAKVWKEKAVASENVKTLTDDLVQVVENPAGSGHTDPPGNIRILGKTGTAELKKDKNDKNSEENGWFVAMDVDNPRLAIAMMIEDVKTRGESHYVVPIVKSIIDDRLK